MLPGPICFYASKGSPRGGFNDFRLLVCEIWWKVLKHKGVEKMLHILEQLKTSLKILCNETVEKCRMDRTLIEKHS